MRGALMEPIFLNAWRRAGMEALLADFGIGPHSLRGFDILLASCGRDEFEGEAFVLLCRDTDLYEVNAMEDSQAGFQGQWQIEETSVEALEYRLERGLLGRTHRDNPFADELRELLAAYSRSRCSS